MRLVDRCKLEPVSEDSFTSTNDINYETKEKDQWRFLMERVAGCHHRLRELSLSPEEDRCPWAALPEVTSANVTGQMMADELESNELLFHLIISEVVYNQELARLVDLARASVRWKDSLPLFNRRSIIGCSLRVKKCSDVLVRTLEEEWSLSHPLVTDLGRIFPILEASFTAATAQTYVAYCDNLDDTRTLFRRATEGESGLMSSVVSARCHIEFALLPIQRLSQLRAALEKIRRILPAGDSNQYLLQCQQLYVTISGIIELCYKVLTSLHGSSYISDIDNLLDFSNKLSTLRMKRHRPSCERNGCYMSRRPPLPLPRGEDTHQSTSDLPTQPNGNFYTATPTLKWKTAPSDEAIIMDPTLNLDCVSHNLIDLRSMENLLLETKVDNVSLTSANSTSSGFSSPDGEYELIEMKEMSKRWSRDIQILQKPFEEQPHNQVFSEVCKGLPEVESQVKSKSMFYAYLDLTENVYEDMSSGDGLNKRPLQPLRTLWCETEHVTSCGILDKLTSSQIALQESKFEILTSEVSYLKSLNVLITLFVESAELKKILNYEDRQDLFSNILKVRKASENFLDDLTGLWGEDLMLTDICSVIHKHAQTKFRVYIEYCSNQQRFNRTLQRLMLDSERFMPLLGQLEGLAACQGYSLQSFLMLPVQRVTRLPLLIDAIQKRVPDNSSEFASCKTALTLVNQLVHECNESVRSNEQAEKVQQALSQRLENNANEREENKINSATHSSKSKTNKTKKKRSSSLPWKLFSSSSLSDESDA